MNYTLSLRLPRMHFYAYHGVLPQERVVGGRYTVSMELTVSDTSAAVMADRLEGTVNYAEVYQLTREVMATPSALLEHVAGRLLRALFARYPRVTAATVTVGKDTPPMGADSDGAAVTLTADNPFATPPKALLLDFDGTLADTSAGIVATMEATFERLSWARPAAEAVCATIGLPLYDAIARLARDITTDRGAIEEAVATYRDLFENSAPPVVTAFPGVVDTLRRAADSGLLLGIATSRGHASVEHLCRQIGIAPYIHAYVAEDDTQHKKPHPEAVVRLLERFGLRPAEALVVGDTTYDIRMGLAAGCPTCGVTYGNHSALQLRAAGADRLVDTFPAVFSDEKERFTADTLS